MITITPPFWQTSWFRFLALAALAAIALNIYGVRVRQLKRNAQRLETEVAERTKEVFQQKVQLETQNQQLKTNEAQLEAQAQKLIELNEMKSRFFANISHEFRTPLTLIMGPLQEAIDGRYGALNDSWRRLLAMMLNNSKRLKRLVNQILDLSKLESDNFQIEVHRQDLTTFVQNLALAFTPLAERHHISLTCDTDSEPLMVHFDTDSLEKALSNLLSNALKFTEAGGSITVVVRQQSGVAEVSVSDTGCGISADQLPFIFDRFYQVDNTPTRPHEGTGIGLALAKDLIALHDGTIEVMSTLGTGSTFTVRLPLEHPSLHQDPLVTQNPTPPQPNLTAPPEDIEIVPEATAPLNVDVPEVDEADITTLLVVDDNADVRAFVRSILEPTYRVLEAENGQRGLDYAQQALPDLIIADVMMPELDGFNLSRGLQNNPMTRSIPVIFLTALATLQDKLTGLGTGAVAYVTKPFEADELRAQVQSLIGFRQRLRERLRQEIERAEMPDGSENRSDVEDTSAFIERVHEVVTIGMHDEHFNVEMLATEIPLSYSRMHARFKDELRMTPGQFIRTERLKWAAQLLNEEKETISDIAYAVGFKSLSYFSKSFRAHFGMTPSDYMNRAK